MCVCVCVCVGEGGGGWCGLGKDWWATSHHSISSLHVPNAVPASAAQVFGGGPVLTANPEPYAEFFDVILMGDGEGILADFTQAMHSAGGGSGSREELLIALSQVHSPVSATAAMRFLCSAASNRASHQRDHLHRSVCSVVCSHH